MAGPVATVGASVLTGAAITSGVGSDSASADRPADRFDECHGRVLRLHRPETVTGSQKLLDPSRILFGDH